MNIVLICIGNFQEYILDNIRQLIETSNDMIYVLTNYQFFHKFIDYTTKILLVPIEELPDSYNYMGRSALNRTSRDGFWVYTSMRFFYLYEFMKKYNVTDVIHLENDVLVYYNCDILNNNLDRKYLYIPFDCYQRNIASIVFVPTHEILKSILDHYDYTLNDMQNFSIIQRKTNVINNFPIFISNSSESSEHQFVTKNYDRFQYLFDAAAMGQYLGGVDPRNIPGDSSKFVNETCIIKYDKYEFVWLDCDSKQKPFLIVNNKTYPIFNLHIHCKNLAKFIR